MELVDQGYLLSEDLDGLLTQATEHYQELTGRVREQQAADN